MSVMRAVQGIMANVAIIPILRRAVVRDVRSLAMRLERFMERRRDQWQKTQSLILAMPRPRQIVMFQPTRDTRIQMGQEHLNLRQNAIIPIKNPAYAGFFETSDGNT